MRISYRTTLVNTLEEFSNHKKLCHIFDFNNNLIEHGWLEHYPSGLKENLAFSMHLDPPNEDDEQSSLYSSYSQFREELSNQDNVRLFVDIENKVKVFIEFYNHDEVP